jgi:hypothetical protein
VGTVEPVLENRVPGKNRDGKAGMRKTQKGENPERGESRKGRIQKGESPLKRK